MIESERIARSLYEAFNERDFDRGAALMHDTAELVVVGSGDRFVGPDGARAFDRMWADAFPDGKITIDSVVAAGDTVVVELTGRGTQTGTLKLPGGEIAATGRSVTLQLCDVIHLIGDKVDSIHTYFDSGSLLTQLGLMPAARAEVPA